MGFSLDEDTFAYKYYKASWWQKLKWRLGIGIKAHTMTFTPEEWRAIHNKNK
jgi:hypothetical protein